MTFQIYKKKQDTFHIGIPQGDGAVFSVSKDNEATIPYNDWTNWDWRLRVVNTLDEALLFELNETGDANGIISDLSIAESLALIIEFYPSAVEDVEPGSRFTWALRGTKSNYVETLIHDGEFVVLKGSF